MALAYQMPKGSGWTDGRVLKNYLLIATGCQITKRCKSPSDYWTGLDGTFKFGMLRGCQGLNTFVYGMKSPGKYDH